MKVADRPKDRLRFNQIIYYALLRFHFCADFRLGTWSTMEQALLRIDRLGRLLCFVVFCIFLSPASAGEYCFEGVFNQPDGDERFFLITQFAPYNPNILAIHCEPEASSICARWWPYGTFFTEAALENSRNRTYDFVWIESEGDELEIVREMSDVLQKATAIYISTHFSNQEIHFSNVRFFLESSGFALLSHWYWEGEKGNAIFLKKEVFDAAMRTLNYSPKPSSFLDYPYVYNLDRFFKKARNKSTDHQLEQIDFIYMINLDERPEKFSKASWGLQLYGISPYRFSAVNGWNLSIETIEQLGLRFPRGVLKEQFMGSIYREINGAHHRCNELIQEGAGTYFSLGLTKGAIGIVLSHLSVLQDAYDAGYQTIWVMEDDVEVVDDPRQIPELIRSLDSLACDWDILFTDTDTKDTRGNHVPCRAMAARPNFCVETLDTLLQRFFVVDQHFSRIGMRYGAYSMIIRRSGMEKILRYFKTYGVFLPYDMDFWLVPNIEMYIVNRDIVSHAPGAPTDNNCPHYLKGA